MFFSKMAFFEVYLKGVIVLEELQTNSFEFDSYTTINDNLVYLDYINRHFDFTEINVFPDVANRFRGNLYGLFNAMNVSEDLYFYTMYINGYNNPTDFDGKKLIFKVAIRPPIPSSSD